MFFLLQYFWGRNERSVLLLGKILDSMSGCLFIAE